MSVNVLRPWRATWLSPLDVRDLTGQQSKRDRPWIQLLGDLGYQPAGDEQNRTSAIWVPRGFECDAASIPRVLWGIYPAWSRANRAAVLHDYLCAIQVCTREKADYLFYESLIACGISTARAWIMWKAVRIGGGSRWKQQTPEETQHVRELARRNGGSLEVLP